MKKLKVLLVGPSIKKARGGISAVTKEILADPGLTERVQLKAYASYIDAPPVKNLIYSAAKLLGAAFVFPRYDVIHIQSAARGSAYRKALYLRLAKLWRKKTVIHIHNSLYLDFYKGLSESRKRFLRTSLQKADLVLVLSENLRKAYRETLELENCQVLGNGVDTELYGSLYDPHLQPENELLFLGKIWQPKGVYDLLQVLRRLKDEEKPVSCVIAGVGELDKARQTAAELDLEDSVSFPGWVDGDAKRTILRDSKILILPSYTEGLPVCILEAMAAGKAIISTTVGAIPEIVEDGANGLLFQPGDLDAMYNCISRLHDDPSLCQTMGHRNFHEARARYNRDSIYDQLHDYYCCVSGKKESE